MPSQAETSVGLLDECIDDLLDGRDWKRRLPSQQPERVRLAQLMAVAVALREAATATPALQAQRRLRLWSRVVAHAKSGSRLRAIALYRLPYLPPLWIRPEAC